MTNSYGKYPCLVQYLTETPAQSQIPYCNAFKTMKVLCVCVCVCFVPMTALPLPTDPSSLSLYCLLLLPDILALGVATSNKRYAIYDKYRLWKQHAFRREQFALGRWRYRLYNYRSVTCDRGRKQLFCWIA